MNIAIEFAIEDKRGVKVNGMTMKQMAAQLNVSVRTVYRRLAENEIDLQTLKDEEGRLTPEGIKVIASLCDSVTEGVTRGGVTGTMMAHEKNAFGTRMAHDGTEKRDKTVPDTGDAWHVDARQAHDFSILAQEMAQMQAQVDTLRVQLNASEAERNVLERENGMLKQMLERAEADREAWKTQAERAQQLQMAQMQLLPPANSGGLGGFLAGLFRRKNTANGE